MKREILCIIMFLSCIYIYGQRNCGSQLNLTELQQTDPARYQRIMDLENQIQEFLNDPVLRSSVQQSTIYIPVVVHIVHKNNAENISDEQVRSQIEVLNEDFRRLNADRTNTPSAFASLAGDANIEFVLAKKDPNGNNTTGITRTFTTQNKFYQNNDNVKFYSLGGQNRWNPYRYLNIWVCDVWFIDDNGNEEELAGYAKFPDQLLTSPNTDGVVINYKYFGRDGSAISPLNKGRTATHEIGHWLNLRHIWGDDDNNDGSCSSDECWGSDEVIDTPNQCERTDGGCPNFPKTDDCSVFNPSIMFMNFMDYSDDACMNLFTNGQVERMRAVLYGYRGEMLAYSHCHNGIQDENETGKDCGGGCPPCPIGGNLDDVVTVGDCSCGYAGYTLENNLNSLFSGNNIFGANIKLSHGKYTNSYRFYSSPISICNRDSYIDMLSELNGGIFFEEAGVQFSPDKIYKLTFNFWTHKGPIHLRLANGLVNTATKKDDQGNSGTYHFQDEIWESSVSRIPQVAETFYIGSVNNVNNDTGCFSDDTNYRYTEVSISFQPDNYYSQLWITTDGTRPINRFEIQEMCIEDVVYNGNSQHIQNPTQAANMIMFENMNYTPTDAVEFIAGNTIVIKNTRIAPQGQGSVHLRIDENVCLNNTPSSLRSSTETLLTTSMDEIKTIQFNGIKLYPNPTTGIVNIIASDNTQIKTIKVFDISGRMLENDIDFVENSLNLSHLNNGTYFIKIQTSIEQITHKIIIKK